MSKLTGREPVITEERPGWEYTEPVTNRPMHYAIGYITDERIPVMALFAGDDNTPMLIPLDEMVRAIKVESEINGD